MGQFSENSMEFGLVWCCLPEILCSKQKSILRKFQRRQTLEDTVKRILCLSYLSSKQIFLNFLELPGAIKLLWSYAAGLQTNKNSMWWNGEGNSHYNEVDSFWFTCNALTTPKWKNLSECHVFFSNFTASNKCFHNTFF